MKKVLAFIRKWRRISFIRTLWINFKCLPFKQAIKFPIICSKCVCFRSLQGTIVLKGEVYTGMITIGFARTVVDSYKKVVSFYNMGTIVFEGKIRIHTGVKLWINSNAELLFGGQNIVGCDTLIVCYKRIEIGYGAIFSWNCQLYDTNFHFYKNLNNNQIVRRNDCVKIGLHVHVGNSCTITKGVIIPNYCCISNCSLVNKSFEDEIEPILIGGLPAKILKRNFIVLWGDDIDDFSLENELAILYD